MGKEVSNTAAGLYYIIVEKLKVNLHITEKCNFHCRYCFAHFNNKKDLPFEAWKEIIDNIAASRRVSTINFAGGEPLIYADFVPLFEYCHKLNFTLSVITNGSLLKDNGSLLKSTNFFPNYWLRNFFNGLDTLGISVDSFSPGTLRKLGCCTYSGKGLSWSDFLAILKMAKAWNPEIKIKVNTVVSSVNINEDLAAYMHNIPLNRWKFLKMKPFCCEGKSNKALSISDEQFNDFCRRNMPKGGIGIAEKEMRNTYIMIDNRGNLLDSSSPTYSIVGNLLEEPFSNILSRYAFNKKEYENRYGKNLL